MSGLLPGDLTRSTVTEIFATSNQPSGQDTLHHRYRIEDERQDLAGGLRRRARDRIRRRRRLPGPGGLGARSRDLERCEPSLDRALAVEAALGRSPPRLDARLAPTQTCTPGQFLTSTPTLSPSPTPSPTPEATVAPTIEPTATPSPTPSPTPAP